MPDAIIQEYIYHHTEFWEAIIVIYANFALSRGRLSRMTMGEQQQIAFVNNQLLEVGEG